MFAWQKNQFKQLWQSRVANRLPHALLLSGITGLGKAAFAEYFSQAILCQNPSTIADSQGSPCGACHACRLVLGRAHPNVMWLTPEKSGQAIKVDQVREVKDFVNQTSLQGEYRVVIIHPADQMNTNAANALLKILEEPAANAILLLTSDSAGQLPATILSRCQKVDFQPPSHEMALEWLQTQIQNDRSSLEQALKCCHGAPLAALDFMKNDFGQSRKLLFDMLTSVAAREIDPIHAAKNLQEIELLQLIDFFLSWVMDVLSIQLNTEAMTNSDYVLQLTKLAESSKIEFNISVMNALQKMREQLCRGLNLNKQLFIESALIKWAECR